MTGTAGCRGQSVRDLPPRTIPHSKFDGIFPEISSPRVVLVPLLMAPRYVKPYVKRNKNDIADAEAICEAVTRPTMRFVEIKSPDRQHAARKRGQIASGPVNGPRGPGRAP